MAKAKNKSKGAKAKSAPMKKAKSVVAKKKTQGAKPQKLASKAKLQSKIVSKSKSKVDLKSKPQSKPALKSQSQIKIASRADQKSAVVTSKKNPKAIALSPVRSRVIIRRDEGEDRTAGGLYIPEVAKEKPAMGRVVAVGTGSYSKKGLKRPLEVRVGDHVLFSQYSGSQIKLGAENLMVVEESEIIGIIND